MMPDLGRYAFEVSAAYIFSLSVLAGLVIWYLARNARMRRDLAEAEERRSRRDG